MGEDVTEVTRIMSAIEQGDSEAVDKLLPLVYEELRLLAAQKMAQELPGQTLQPTALVHEAYIRLLGSESPSWKGKSHFFAAAAEAMRRILVENARRKKSLKHVREKLKVCMEGLESPFDSAPEDLIALDEALIKLNKKEPDVVGLVKLRYFAGMTVEQIAKIQGISSRTVFNHLAYARAWLRREISECE
jgi:RNA polymerase sigma factor (TIGR02999 family)